MANFVECPPGKEYVFRQPDGREVGRARNVKQFESMLKTAPLSSVLYHANGGHFAPWLAFMGKKNIAEKSKKIKGSGDSVRKALVALFKQ